MKQNSFYIGYVELTKTQTPLVEHLIVNSPWFKTKAKACSFANCHSDARSTLTFEVFTGDDPRTKEEADRRENTDNHVLLNMLGVATLFGYPERTVKQISDKIWKETDRLRTKALRERLKAS